MAYHGEDLAWFARHCGLTAFGREDRPRWRAPFFGFAPGFSYFLGGDPRLRVPGRGESRAAVAAAAVAIAGSCPRSIPAGHPVARSSWAPRRLPMWDAAAIRLRCSFWATGSTSVSKSTG